jgi:hypothetical protein
MSYQTSRAHAATAKAGGLTFPSGKFYGLLELDEEGTVLYSRVEPDGAASGAGALDLTGLNFYKEVAPFSNVGEFRHQLDSFRRGQQPATSLDFTCEYEDGPLTVRMLLARIRERSELNTTKSVLVHIRKAR